MNLIEIVITNTTGDYNTAPNELLSKATGYTELGTGRGIYFAATDQPVSAWVNTLKSLGLQGIIFAVDTSQVDMTHAPNEMRTFFAQYFPHLRVVAA